MSGTKEKAALQTKVGKAELEVYDNTTDAAIHITESKARLIYEKHMNKLSGGVVLSLLGMFVTCLTTVITATFNDVFGIQNSAIFMKLLFGIFSFVFGIATVVGLVKWVHAKKKFNEETFINSLKGN